MQVFTSEELQLHPAEVQQSALAEPTMITVHGRPRLVMMSVDEYDRLRARRHLVLQAAELSGGIVSEMNLIVAKHPVDEADLGLIGGLLDEQVQAGGSGSA